MERTLGVTGPQRLVIRLVGRFPGVSAGQLAEVMSVHPSTMTGILRRLEARGLVQRRVDARDRRRLFLGLTAAGRELNVTESGTVEAAVDRVIHSLPEKRIAAAREVLATLARALAL